MLPVQVVAEAMNCLANIAKGMRKDYRGPAASFCPGQQCHLQTASLQQLAASRAWAAWHFAGTRAGYAVFISCLRQCLLVVSAVILEKFKDKAAVVGKAAAEALDAMAKYSFTLPDVAEVGRDRDRMAGCQ